MLNLMRLYKYFLFLLQASPENSRNASPRYHDASMEDVSSECIAVSNYIIISIFRNHELEQVLVESY